MNAANNPYRVRTRCNKEITAGIASSIEASILFYQWADSQGTRLSAAGIANRFGCSRATSYRYLRAFHTVRERMAAKEVA